jgi:hypothetical protein
MVRTTHYHRETMRGPDGYRSAAVSAGPIVATVTGWNRDGRLDIELRDAERGRTLYRLRFDPDTWKLEDDR